MREEEKEGMEAAYSKKNQNRPASEPKSQGLPLLSLPEKKEKGEGEEQSIKISRCHSDSLFPKKVGGRYGAHITLPEIVRL